MAQEDRGGTADGARVGEERAAGQSAPIDAYEPPALVVLGTVAELTRGNNTQAHTDGTFPGSLFV